MEIIRARVEPFLLARPTMPIGANHGRATGKRRDNGSWQLIVRVCDRRRPETGWAYVGDAGPRGPWRSIAG